MIQLRVEIKNLDELRANFSKAPGLALKYLAAATQASIFEIEKRADDSGNGGLFRFKMPRGMRTGYLALSFSFGRQFRNGGLLGSIGPTAWYAPVVYFGTRSGRPNYFMDRIAAAAEDDVRNHFETAVDKLTGDIANI